MIQHAGGSFLVLNGYALWYSVNGIGKLHRSKISKSRPKEKNKGRKFQNAEFAAEI